MMKCSEIGGCPMFDGYACVLERADLIAAPCEDFCHLTSDLFPLLRKLMAGEIPDVNLDAMKMSVEYDNVVLLPLPRGTEVEVKIPEDELHKDTGKVGK